jgi:hypothetical protein
MSKIQLNFFKGRTQSISRISEKFAFFLNIFYYEKSQLSQNEQILETSRPPEPKNGN